VVPLIADALVGIAAGALALGVVSAIQRVRKVAA
jgi:hypothetical protein